jgi:predicted amidohydrolase YtcJ
MEVAMTNQSVPITTVFGLSAALSFGACAGGTHGLSPRAGAGRPPVRAPSPCGGGSAPQLVLVNGTIFTADLNRPRAEAIAVAGQRICAVGTTDEIRRLSTGATRIVDLGGKLVIPGINDAHLHEPRLFRTAAVDTRGAISAGELIRSLATQAKTHPSGTWLRGELPLSLIDAPGIERATLDAQIPDYPLLLSVFGGHAGVLNSAGLQAIGVTDDGPRSQRGRYGQDRSGRPNGWLYEYAFSTRGAVGALTDQNIGEAAERFAAEAVRFGITSVQTMAIDVPGERLAAVLAERKPLVRWRVIRFPTGNIQALPKAATPSRPDARVRLFGVKYILDGTPIERGAAQKGGYADKPDQRTTINFSDDEIRQMLEIARASGEPLLLHVAGDAPLDAVLRVMESQGGLDSWKSSRIRFEHGDGIMPDLFDALVLAGIVVVQNPTHFTLTDVLRARLGPRRIAGYQPWASLAAAGIPIAIGSDGALNPFLNIMLAATHPMHPAEAITRERAVIAYTRGAAYAERAEDVKGTLAPGMLADIAVLSRNIFEIALDQLPSVESVLTIVGGDVVYERAGP